ncbi:MAG: hypothetical protein Q9222_002113 [Ikaeria aurantiellina]
MSIQDVTGIVDCSVQGTTSAVCTVSGIGVDVSEATVTEDTAAAATGDAPVSNSVLTSTLLPEEIHYTQIPITGGYTASAQATGEASTATSTGGSSKTSSMASTTGTQTAANIGQAAPSPSGTTGGATSLDRSSMVALVGAAALAAIII